MFARKTYLYFAISFGSILIAVVYISYASRHTGSTEDSMLIAGPLIIAFIVGLSGVIAGIKSWRRKEPFVILRTIGMVLNALIVMLVLSIVVTSVIDLIRTFCDC
jgi:uncharacterized membrane protein YsdA (DUF1294 family)